MEKIGNIRNYDIYAGSDKGNHFYNAVPEGQPAPDGGYAFEIIAGIKRINKDSFAEVVNNWLNQTQKQ